MKLPESIRLPYVAGQFYDADSERLASNIGDMLSECKGLEKQGNISAVIIPHAGYIYSGKTALKTLFTASGKSYKRAVVIAPSHRSPFIGAALSDHDYYRTPLGDLKVDKSAVNNILRKENPYIHTDNGVHEYEHALEVELPLLQYLFKDLTIVPIICGHLDSDTPDIIAKDLLSLWDDETLWVISSDFTHFGASFGYTPFKDNIQESIEKLDNGAIDHIINLNLKGFTKYIDKTGATVCGSNPIKILLSVISSMKKSGKKFESKLVDYTNSGRLTGDFNHSVSYAGIAISEE